LAACSRQRDFKYDKIKINILGRWKNLRPHLSERAEFVWAKKGDFGFFGVFLTFQTQGTSHSRKGEEAQLTLVLNVFVSPLKIRIALFVGFALSVLSPESPESFMGNSYLPPPPVF